MAKEEAKENDVKKDTLPAEGVPRITKTPIPDDEASNGGRNVSRTPSVRDDDDVSSEIMRVEENADPEVLSQKPKSRQGAFTRLVRTIQVGHLLLITSLLYMYFSELR